MSTDFEELAQYTTPFSCPECREHTFQTAAQLDSATALTGAECTNCGHALTSEEIASQEKTLPAAAIEKMIAESKAH